MEHIVIGVLANSLRSYSIYRFMELLYFPKKTNKYLKVSLYVVFVILTSGGYYIFQNQVVNIITNLIGLSLIVMAYRGSLKRNLLIILSIYSINVVVESLVFSINEFDSYNKINESANECITSIGILLIVIILEKTKAIKNKELEIGIPLMVGSISIPIVSIWMILILQNNQSENEYFEESLIVGILVINIVIFYLYGVIQDYYKEKSEKEEFFHRMKIYSNQLEILKESSKKIKELRHDMKHHLAELKYLVENEEKERTLSYIHEMEKHMINTDESISSGNRDIDGILNYILQMHKESLENVDLHVTVPEDLEIHNYLFNVIFGNLLENAVYAALNSEKKYLKVHIKVKQQVLYLSIDNSFCGEIKTKHDKILTTKENNQMHGIGLESVKRMVAELNGMMGISWKNNIFSVAVMFYMKNLG